MASQKTRQIGLNRATVLVLVDPDALIPGSSRFAAHESDRYVAESLQKMVKQVVVRPYIGLAHLLLAIAETSPDMVFNLTQRVYEDREKDLHITAILDLQEIPYTGAGPRGLMLGRDKAMSKVIAAQAGFKVPRFFLVWRKSPKQIPPGTTFPTVIKPRFADASEGISQASVVRNPGALWRRINHLRRVGFHDIICEEYVPGREMIVGIVGDRVVAPREFIVGRSSDRGSPLVASTNFKYDKAYRRRWQIRTEYAKLTRRQKAELNRLVRSASEALEMRDYGRLDVRLTRSGDWVFLESNPNPGLARFGTSFAGTWGGIDYDFMIKDIALRALHRCGP